MAAVATASASAAGLTGAGSTLVAPLMANWISTFEIREGIPVKYGAVGSGAGIAQITARTVDFGASDAPLTPEQATACNGCVQIPWALSATGIGFNIPGVKKLNLTGKIIAGIYFGKITKWNDPKIKKINPKTKLPGLTITPVFRSDGSGDTYAFTNYLSKVSASWKNEVGYATSVGFKAGVGAKGNSGVTSTVTKTSGAIGYISASYLIAAGLGAAAVQNNAGNYEFPNLSNIESAASTVKSLPASNAVSITNPPKKATTAYPISTFTYAIVPHSAPQKGFLQQFLNYAVTKGQKYGAALDFAPLPKVVLSAAKRAIASL
ncbi:MAG TPA: phosphate ABC transporter substrate-binding protein PstS [Solirubrobacterales bacterium]|jgi:phosphate transport system substrate-binding protein|nr:phosphate ABC transporter substrate-binding protein PstS [Solirubrobacterales bacterium]